MMPDKKGNSKIESIGHYYPYHKTISFSKSLRILLLYEELNFTGSKFRKFHSFRDLHET